MLKKFLMFFVVVALFAACSDGEGSENGDETVDSNAVEYQVMEVATFTADAATFVDEKVIITGIVDHVCKHGGKKLTLVVDGVTTGIHVTSEEAFDESLAGSEVTVIGIVREFIVDEAYLNELEADAIEHENDADDAEGAEHADHKRADIKYYRDSMATAGVEYLSFYSLEFVSFQE